jgi:hypothetical protein
LFGEYMNERLLLRLPHRQMVFTFPKVLRGFFRHHRTLYGQITRQVYAMISTFYNATAGCRVHSAALIAYGSAGEFARFNPHLHAIVLEGGFDPAGRFVHIPQLDLARLSQYFRASMVAFFFKCQLINERLARNMLQWDHSGFSIPASSSKTREALSQIHRPGAGVPQQDGRGRPFRNGPVPHGLQPLLPHQPQALPRQRLHRRVATASS